MCLGLVHTHQERDSLPPLTSLILRVQCVDVSPLCCEVHDHLDKAGGGSTRDSVARR